MISWKHVSIRQTIRKLGSMMQMVQKQDPILPHAEIL